MTTPKIHETKIKAGEYDLTAQYGDTVLRGRATRHQKGPWSLITPYPGDNWYALLSLAECKDMLANKVIYYHQLAEEAAYRRQEYDT